MFAIITFIFILTSGSAFLACKWRLKFEFALPITVAGIILIQYLIGSIGFLPVGFFVTFGIGLFFLWIYAIYKIRTRDSWENFKGNFFNRGFVAFIIFCVLLTFFLHGMMIHVSDEYSYWGKVVKGMVYWGDFSTNEMLDIGAFDYPPGIALIQYFLEKTGLLFGGEFQEWLLYFSKDIIYIAFMLPLMEVLHNKKSYIGAILLFSLLPLYFYRDFYYTLYADGMIGALVGLALMSLFRLHNEMYGHFYMLSAVFVVTLIKPSGVVFASVVAIIYIMVIFKDHEVRYKYSRIASIVVTILCTYGIWQIKVKQSGRLPFLSNKVDWGILVDVITGRDDTYRATVYERFLHALTDVRVACFSIPILGQEVKLPYILVLLATLFFGIVVYCNFKSQGTEQNWKRYRVVLFCAFVHWGIFYVGLGLTYLFKFSEVQALEIMSYDRYENPLYLYMAMFIVYSVLLFYKCRSKQKIGKKIILGISIFIVVTLPWKTLISLATRQTAHETIAVRSAYTVLVNKINKNVEADGRVYFICQDDRSWYNSESDIAIGLEVYPVHLQYGNSYFTTDDSQWFTTNMDVGGFRELLIHEEWTHIAVYRQDEYFKEFYADLFADPASIADDSLYQINADTGLAEKIE